MTDNDNDFDLPSTDGGEASNGFQDLREYLDHVEKDYLAATLPPLAEKPKMKTTKSKKSVAPKMDYSNQTSTRSLQSISEEQAWGILVKKGYAASSDLSKTMKPLYSAWYAKALNSLPSGESDSGSGYFTIESWTFEKVGVVVFWAGHVLGAHKTMPSGKYKEFIN